MKILIAEDDPVSSCFLEASLEKWGYEVVVASDGVEAWSAFQVAEPPSMAILDWMMPEIDGVEICRRLRAMQSSTPVYVIMLTAKSDKEDVVAGLKAGADDYVTKPFNRHELRARIDVGVRMLELQANLSERVRDLEEALARVQQLHGLLPICSYCRKVRDDHNYWQQVENYLAEHSAIEFSHGICPTCFETLIRPEIQKLMTTDESAEKQAGRRTIRLRPNE
jgi:phosphoserine phosphatase RsbU/P